jgi:predicted metal-dependent HD superfamily phosphohydrolase
MSYKKTIKKLYHLLENELSPDLCYHGIHHTQDVHRVCQFYIEHYELSENDAMLLEIAAVGHDTGFTKSYSNHEEISADITSAIMKSDGFSTGQVDKVSEMILATKIPQNPSSFLCSLLCDADLDYLGRDDFEEIGSTLKQEWINFKLFPNLDENFDNIQIGFLKGHCYHTDYAKEHRSPVKINHLERLEEEQRKKIPK